MNRPITTDVERRAIITDLAKVISQGRCTREPFTFNGFCYATNGIIASRYAAPDAVDDLPEGSDLIAPLVSGAFSDIGFNDEHEWAPMPRGGYVVTPDYERCVSCSRFGVRSPNIIIPCEGCDGTGRVMRGAARLGDSCYSLTYITTILDIVGEPEYALGPKQPRNITPLLVRSRVDSIEIMLANLKDAGG